MRIGQIYLTAMLAAVPAAVAVILATTPAASPANVQRGFNAALQNAAPLNDPCDIGGNCNIPGIPGNIDRPDVDVPHVDRPDIDRPDIGRPDIGR